MNANAWLPVAILLSSLLPGIAIFLLREEQHRTRTALNLIGAGIKVLLVAAMLLGVLAGRTYETRIPLLPDMDLLLHADSLSVLFATLSAILWFVTTVYAVGYLEGEPHRSRFFGFFSICVSATVGIAMAGNLITFLMFYELLTLSTYPLVAHRGTAEALHAGRIYLAYTLSGGAVLLVAVAWLRAVAGPVEFAVTGSLAHVSPDMRPTLTVIFALLIAGLGVKASLVPLHGWLPAAMVAPAPVSALLHAVAVVKAGAFGIVRVVFDVYGVQFAANLGVLGPLAAVATVTILWGSVRALYQTEIKRRLAYSTVSQVSYIILGAAIGGPLGTIGGLVHLVHQGLMKITLFFCAGNLAETLGVHRIKEMNGVGRRMPWTMLAFTVAALGMIGVPPVAGFITKWYLTLGGIRTGQNWVLALLLVSTALNAAYFLPMIYKAWFTRQGSAWPSEHIRGRLETHHMLLFPTIATALMALGVGLLANAPLSPLDWVKLIARREYTG